MKLNPSGTLRVLWLALLFLCSSPLRAEQFGLFTYQVVNDTSVTITDYPDNATGPVEIPSEIAGKPVTSLEGAFWGCTGLTSVTIPSGVISIGELAFSECTGLTSFTIPSSVTSIGLAAFRKCTQLTSIIIPSSVTSISASAFAFCTGLTGIIIPSSVTSINFNSFADCTGLTSAFIPSSVTSIGDGAFSGCTGLTGIIIPSSVTMINFNAFAGCTGLSNVIIPSSVTRIAEGAFYCCTGLTSITIPSSVTSIRLKSFAYCTGLTSVRIPSSVKTIDESAFYCCTGLTSITIPSSVTRMDRSFVSCTKLTNVAFSGNMPVMYPGSFDGSAPGFTIYYLSRSSGFTSPKWQGYPVIMINETTYPAARWLMNYGLRHDTGLHTDPDVDGVDLRMAWALKLDPSFPQQNQLPVPVLNGNTLSLGFHASTPGFTYRAETSTDLVKWTTTGVTQSAPGPEGRSTASVTRDAPTRYLRLALGN